MSEHMNAEQHEIQRKALETDLNSLGVFHPVFSCVISSFDGIAIPVLTAQKVYASDNPSTSVLNDIEIDYAIPAEAKTLAGVINEINQLRDTRQPYVPNNGWIKKIVEAVSSDPVLPQTNEIQMVYKAVSLLDLSESEYVALAEYHTKIKEAETFYRRAELFKLNARGIEAMASSWLHQERLNWAKSKKTSQ